MKIVFDTDILSCIAKAKLIDFIKKVFPDSDFIIPWRVYEEILKAKKFGYDFAGIIIDLIDDSTLAIPALSNEEENKIRELERTNLHFGEIEAIVLSMRKNSILLSNDSIVKKEAKKLEINIFNLEDILSYSIEKKVILDHRQLIDLINEIESKDKIKIKNKHYLFNKLYKNSL